MKDASHLSPLSLVFLSYQSQVLTSLLLFLIFKGLQELSDQYVSSYSVQTYYRCLKTVSHSCDIFFNFSVLFQLLVSSYFLWKECQSSSFPRMTTEWKSVRLFLIPSIIYLVHNNVQFATLTYVDPSTYQIMGNLKIVTTGILFRYLSWFLKSQIKLHIFMWYQQQPFQLLLNFSSNKIISMILCISMVLTITTTFLLVFQVAPQEGAV